MITYLHTDSFINSDHYTMTRKPLPYRWVNPCLMSRLPSPFAREGSASYRSQTARTRHFQSCSVGPERPQMYVGIVYASLPEPTPMATIESPWSLDDCGLVAWPNIHVSQSGSDRRTPYLPFCPKGFSLRASWQIGWVHGSRGFREKGIIAICARWCEGVGWVSRWQTSG